MTDPERLLRGDATDAERALLRAGDAEEPPPDGAERLAALLLAAPGAAGGGAAGAGKGGAGASLAPGAPLVAKWAMLAAASVVAIGGAVAVVSPSKSAAPMSSAVAAHGVPPSVTAPGAAKESSSRAEPEEPEEGDVGPARDVERGAERAAAHVDTPRHRAATSMGGAPSIAGEITSLDEVRTRLARGDAKGALAELDRYKSRSPQGALAQEATLLRIEALARAGDRTAARGLGLRYLAKHPDTPHAARVRALIGDAP